MPDAERKGDHKGFLEKIVNKFSFIVTCFNLEKYIERCLSSLIDQDYPKTHYQIVCVDDGSTDRSLEIIKGLEKKHADILIISQKNAGLERSCNRGIGSARYDWIVRVDGDDFLDPSYLRRIDEAMKNGPKHDFYYCKGYFEYYSEEKSYFKEVPDFNRDEIFERGDFFATATAYQRSDLSEIGFFPEGTVNCGLENYSVILSLLSLGKKGKAVEGAIFYYRRHETNMSTLRRSQIILFGKELLKGYGRDFKTNKHHPYGLVLDSANQEI